MNSVFFDEALIDRWITEDAPLLDLTTHVLGVGDAAATMRWRLRGAGVVACTEEAARVVQRCGGRARIALPSGARAEAGALLLHAQGPAEALLRAWKVVQNLLESACGIATATATMVEAVRAVAPDVAVLTTRKHPPGLKAIALKASLCGGALPHRLGVGETVLVFDQHRALLGSWAALGARLRALGHALAEKKIVVEVQTLDDARQALAAGAEVLQFDKANPADLRAWSTALRTLSPAVHLLAAGGIGLANAAEYAASGVDALVTSSLYHAAPADVGVQLLSGEGD